MPQLSLAFLGSFDAHLEDRPCAGFRSDKARALLAYLAVERDRPHTRSKLAGLLWPDAAETTALTYLRHALANLHKVLDDRAAAIPFLHTHGDAIRFNTHSPCTSDVTTFTTVLMALTSPGAPPLTAATVQPLQNALALYRGPFLEGFTLADSDRFEEWILLRREQLHQLTLTGLDKLVTYYLEQGAAAQALPYLQRYIELEPTGEQGQQRLIRLLLHLGQPSAALAQFERCRAVLANELGVTPTAETLALYQQLQAHTDDRPTLRFQPATQLPSFLAAPHVRLTAPPPLLARQDEVTLLQQPLTRACAGLGGLVWISGEAGQGKTTLAHGFAQQAQAAHHHLVVVTGNCNAHTGLGDPYSPFRQVLALLTGDVEARWRAGTLTRAHATQLWHLLPHTVTAILAHGPDLVETLLPAQSLLRRAADHHGTTTQAGAGWLAELQAIADRQAVQGEGRVAPRQSDLFAQYTQVLQAVADQQPLLIVLDDLQWADLGSLHLLLHLGRQLGQSRILIVALYRPADIAAGRSGHPHPLLDVLHELPRHAAVTEVPLAHADGRRLVDALLDSEPNLLGEAFRQQLHHYTKGNPLFTIELVRGMQTRGDLVRDSEGHWQAGQQLNWEQLPPRVEAVIGERILRLAPELQEVLTLAGVEGESFTAEVIAQALRVTPQEVVRWLSRELDRQHQLVTLQSVQHLGEQPITTYRFRHILFQKYLYSRLDEAERIYLHRDVGVALEGLYRGQLDTNESIAGQLARHFEEAGTIAKAIHYLRQAVEHGLRLSAQEETIALLQKALALVKQLPDTIEQQHVELALRLRFGTVMLAARTYGAREIRTNFELAYTLAQQVGDTPQRMAAHWGLRSHYSVSSQNAKALAIEHEYLTLAQAIQSPDLLLEAHRNIGFTLVHLGEFREAKAHLEQGLTFYQPRRSTSAFQYGRDTGISCLNYLARCLWMLGYPDQALDYTHQAFTLAQELAHPMTLAYAGATSVHITQLRGNFQAMQEYLESALALLQKHHFQQWIACQRRWQGWLLVQQGHFAEGILQLQQGSSLADKLGYSWQKRHFLGLLADAHKSANQIQSGLAVITQTLEHEPENDDQYGLPDIYRLKGELLLMQDDGESVTVQASEACFDQAIALARRQEAKSLELRAATSLARHWQRQGRYAEALHLLQPVYAWFTEGFDTADLCAAKALLDALGDVLAAQP